MPIALILFIAMPIMEIALLLRVGSAIGWVWTLLIVIATAVLGSTMLRQQGLATLSGARQRLDAGEMPAQELLEGMMIMIGGVLLLTPGFVTDAFGFACLVPASRRWLAGRLASRAMTGFVSVSATGATRSRGQAYTSYGPGSSSTSSTSNASSANSRNRQSPFQSDGEVIDGNFERLDD